jgi:threonine dehydratase
MPVSLSDIRAARRRIASGIIVSPCPASIPLSEITGAQIVCKLDNFQRTGSFKERGARNALLRLAPAARRRGVVAASAGNHALGLAYHGKLLDIPVTVVMPDYAPLIKITTCQRLGAKVIVQGRDFVEARRRADALAAEHGFTYIHGFDHPDIIAGQGTMGLEILEQVRDADAIVCPVGGGGLIAGLALAVKSLRPKVRVIGVESAATGNFAAALRAGRPVLQPRRPTLADGLATLTVGANAFALARRHVDQVVSVSEDWIALAILRMVELEKTVVEGAAAVPLAAMMAGRLPELRGKKVVLAVCGGNIDPAILSRVIEQGLVHDGRLTRFTAIISDRPGGLAQLTRVIAESGASIKDIAHDRAFSGPDVSAVHAVCTVETRDRPPGRELSALRRPTVRRHRFPLFFLRSSFGLPFFSLSPPFLLRLQRCSRHVQSRSLPCSRQIRRQHCARRRHASPARRTSSWPLSSITKQFGEGSIMRLGENSHKMKVETLTTGSLAVDSGPRRRRPAQGRIIEIYGPESSGKTTFCLERHRRVPKSAAASPPSSTSNTRSTRSTPAWSASIWTTCWSRSPTRARTRSTSWRR